MYSLHGYSLTANADLGACHDHNGKPLLFPTLKMAEKKATELNRAYGGNGLVYAPAVEEFNV
jgi:hypothetical protein